MSFEPPTTIDRGNALRRVAVRVGKDCRQRMTGRITPQARCSEMKKVMYFKHILTLKRYSNELSDYSAAHGFEHINNGGVSFKEVDGIRSVCIIAANELDKFRGDTGSNGLIEGDFAVFIIVDDTPEIHLRLPVLIIAPGIGERIILFSMSLGGGLVLELEGSGGCDSGEELHLVCNYNFARLPRF